jgi:hypothetical protein
LRHSGHYLQALSKVSTFLLIALVVFIHVFYGLDGVSVGSSSIEAVEAVRSVPVRQPGFALQMIGTLIYALILNPLCLAAMVHNISQVTWEKPFRQVHSRLYPDCFLCWELNSLQV